MSAPPGIGSKHRTRLFEAEGRSRDLFNEDFGELVGDSEELIEGEFPEDSRESDELIELAVLEDLSNEDFGELVGESDPDPESAILIHIFNLVPNSQSAAIITFSSLRYGRIFISQEVNK